MPTPDAVVVGAGPAGLTAAYVLAKAGRRPLVLEAGAVVGGISRTETYRGYRFDIGGHRFYTKVPEVEALWHEILDDGFIETPRLSRIFYQGRYYPYPLELWPTLRNLGPVESARIMASYVRARLRVPYPVAENLEEWVTNRFGPRLYRTFFKTYTEKVWGMPCTDIRADWAAQRIRELSLRRAIAHAVFGNGKDTTLIGSFHYPRLGPGQMWEAAAEKVTALGGEVRMNAEVVALHHAGGRVERVTVREGERTYDVAAPHVVNSMPVGHLVERLDPAPPAAALAAARGLRYRDFLIVALVVDREHLFPDNWIYVHSPEVRVGRIQNFKSWSPAMVPDPSKTCLGMEYFCTRGDAVWDAPDDALLRLATRELAALGLASAREVVDGTVIRQPMAYPVYDADYRGHLDALRGYLGGFANLQTTGRAGMHRYNNQDHSMLTGLLAAQRVLGDASGPDLWDVNVERSYLEDVAVDARPAARPAALSAAGRG